MIQEPPVSAVFLSSGSTISWPPWANGQHQMRQLDSTGKKIEFANLPDSAMQQLISKTPVGGFLEQALKHCGKRLNKFILKKEKSVGTGSSPRCLSNLETRCRPVSTDTWGFYPNIHISMAPTMNLSTFLDALTESPKRFIFLRFVGLLCLLFDFLPANADWHGELTFRSDYVYHGYSKSRGDPVVQGLIDYRGNSGWFGGLGLSQVSFDSAPNTSHAEVEIRPFAGWSLPLATDWSTELAVSGYIYNGKIFGQSADYADFSATLNYQDWFSGTISVAPNAYQRHGTVPNYELNFRRDILDTVQFSGGLGYAQAGALLGQNYFYWNLGASWFLTSYLTLDARYVDVHLNEYNDAELNQNDFNPRPLKNKYLLSITLGF
jgi:uncharacterized protein (TIGR02001 family)